MTVASPDISCVKCVRHGGLSVRLFLGVCERFCLGYRTSHIIRVASLKEEFLGCCQELIVDKNSFDEETDGSRVAS